MTFTTKLCEKQIEYVKDSTSIVLASFSKKVVSFHRCEFLVLIATHKPTKSFPFRAGGFITSHILSYRKTILLISKINAIYVY